MSLHTFTDLLESFMHDIEISASQVAPNARFVRFDFVLSAYDAPLRPAPPPDVCYHCSAVGDRAVIELRAPSALTQMRERTAAHVRSFNLLHNLLTVADIDLEERIRVNLTMDQLRHLFVRLCEDVILALQVSTDASAAESFSALLRILQPYTAKFDMYV